MDVSSGFEGRSDTQIQTKRAIELAERQFGAIARRQLLALGFSPTRVRGWVARGRLHPVHPGVYALGRPGLGTEGDLAAGLLLAGHGSAIGGISALWWMDLLNRRPALIHIDAPGYRAPRGNVAIRHPGEVERLWRGGLPVVPLHRALLASASELSHDSLRLVLARAEFHKLLSLSSLQVALGRGRPGSRAIRAAMDAHLPQLARCANRLERDFVLLCEQHRLPIPEPNERVGRYRPDMIWPDARLIVELDGKDAHSTPAQIEADRHRQFVLEELGFVVLRFTWEQVQSEQRWVAAVVRRHLGDG